MKPQFKFRFPKKHILAILVAVCATSLILVTGVFAAAAPDYYSELYRSKFHFSPEVNWMNDPNGLVYYQGEYHLFYQYNPHANVWGPMHWGHAVSTDLVHWTHLPVALYPDSIGTMYSGSIVVDTNNTSGFFTGSGGSGLVAIYTTHGTSETQSIAYSTDRGRTWTKYASNPVIANPGVVDFRDPKVFWYAPTSRWIMVVAGGEVRFYSSTNLKNWTLESTTGIFTECPDIFPLAVDGNAANQKWVLSQGGENYRIGSFNGHVFTTEGGPYRMDYGPDAYASQSYSDIPASDGRRIWLSWLQSDGGPTFPWKSEMTVPHSLSLKTFPEGIRLVQLPVTELQSLRGTKTSFGTQTISPGTNIISSLQGNQVELVAEFQLGTATEFGFRVRKGGTQYTTIGYKPGTSVLFVDRNNSSPSGICCTGYYEAPLAPVSNRVKIRVLVDSNSVEVFGQDGKVDLTLAIFPDSSSSGLELYAIGGNVTLISFDEYPINSIWPTTSTASGLTNGDFESGNLSSWTIASGTAFSPLDVTNLTTAVGGNGQTFYQHGAYHLWGFKDGGDGPVGELRSATVTLGGNGQVNLLVSGGFDYTNLYVALVRASDSAILFKATGHDSESYRRVVWDASPYIGQNVYVKLVDNLTTGWASINLDDVRVPTAPASQSPYGGTAWAIPGTIQAENFDLGGEGVAYHDLEPANQSGQYRADGVDIEATTDAGGGYNVDYTAAGDWMEYTVNVATAGSYTLTERIAALTATQSFRVEFNGVDKTGTVAIPNTGGWQTWVNLSQTVNLSAGVQVMRIYFLGNDGNLNYVSLSPASGPTPTRTRTPTPGPTATPTRTPTPGPAGVIFYQDINYGGVASSAIAKGDYAVLPGSVPNDWMSSLKVPAGWIVDAYADGSFGGAVCTFTVDTTWVGTACNDNMSSVKIH